MASEATAPARAHRKVRIGKVVSNKMNKTIVIAVERRIPHPLFKKFYKQTAKFMAHDEKQIAKLGDIVQIVETRPMSKNKRWRLVSIVEKAK